MDSQFAAFKDQPEYQLFRRAYAERKAPLVIISGSGLSAPAGLPTWSKLRVNLQNEAEKKLNSLSALGEAFQRPRIDALKRQSNSWVAFKLLREILTPPVFEALVENELSPADDAGVPQTYDELLKLQPIGFVTLNLDTFAGEALAKSYTGKPVTPIYGKELAEKWHSMRAVKTFLVYLHGGLHDPATWILTQDDLSELQNQKDVNIF